MPTDPGAIAGWKHGDPVSTVSHGILITGKVVQLKRERDGRPFLMVQIVGGGRIGHRTWPDGFVLGHGRLERWCQGCQRHYRTDDQAQDFCLACDRHVRGTESLHETRSIGGTLRGASTPIRRARVTATDDEIATELQRRQDETPF